MKRAFLSILVLVILIGMVGCGAAVTTTQPSQSQTQTTTTQSQPLNTTQATTAVTTAMTTAMTTAAPTTVAPTTKATTGPAPTTTTVAPSQTTVVHPVYQAKIQLEGMDETVNYRLTEGRYDYAMPMDVDRFRFREGEEADYFHSILNDKVFLTVTYIEDSNNATETAIRTNVAEGIKATANTGKLGNHDVAIVHVTYGDQPDSTIMDFYLIENDGGVYEINMIYTLETAEGFGARMFYMAEGFVIR